MKSIRMNFTVPGMEDALLAGRKTLTTRTSTYGMDVDEVATLNVRGSKFLVRLLGNFTVDGIGEELGGINNYLQGGDHK